MNKTDKLLANFKGRQPELKTPIATDMFLPNLSGDLSYGNVRNTPTSDTDPANKKYVDDSLGNYLKLDCSNDPLSADLEIDDGLGVNGTPELSFNGGRAKVMFDGATASVKLIGGAGKGIKLIVDNSTTEMSINTDNTIDMFGALDMNSNAITNATNTNWDTAYTHSQDNTQAHSDYLLNSGTDSAVGPITITADNSSADTAYVPMVLYNTDATPPAASGFPIGTIYIQYTA